MPWIDETRRKYFFGSEINSHVNPFIEGIPPSMPFSSADTPSQYVRPSCVLMRASGGASFAILGGFQKLSSPFSEHKNCEIPLFVAIPENADDTAKK